MGSPYVPSTDPLTDENRLITDVWRRYQEYVASAITPGAANFVLTSNGTALVWKALVDINIGGAASIAWSKIDKTGSSLADLTTRSAGALNSGTLDDARLSANVSLFGTSVPWANVNKAGSSLADLATRSAADLSSGTLNDARLSANVLLGTATTYTPTMAFYGFNTAATVAAGATVYVGTLGESATETIVSVVVPKAGVLRRLYVVSSAVAGVGESFTYTVRKNAADTAITAAITGGAATTANDTTNTVAVAAGDRVAVKIVTTGGAAAVRHAIGLEVASE